MSKIEERAKVAAWQIFDEIGLSEHSVDRVSEIIEEKMSKQKAIDDAECVNQVIMGKGSAINHYKQGYQDAVNKACELLKAVGVLTDDDSIMGFIKAMGE